MGFDLSLFAFGDVSPFSFPLGVGYSEIESLHRRRGRSEVYHTSHEFCTAQYPFGRDLGTYNKLITT